MSRNREAHGRILINCLLCVTAALIALVLAMASPAVAQTADTTAIDAYLHAITQTQATSRLAALERFASSAPTSNLRIDALEWIVWDERQTGNGISAKQLPCPVECRRFVCRFDIGRQWLPAPARRVGRQGESKGVVVGVDVGGQHQPAASAGLGDGGAASFISAPDQFRSATQQVAGSIGIPFQF